MLRPWRVAALTFEQCLELVRQGQASTAVAMELRQHLGQGLAALRLCGPDGADSNGRATFPVKVVVTFHPSGKTETMTFTRDSCQVLDIEPGSYGAVLEDQSGQSHDGGFTIEQ